MFNPSEFLPEFLRKLSVEVAVKVTIKIATPIGKWLYRFLQQLWLVSIQPRANQLVQLLNTRVDWQVKALNRDGSFLLEELFLHVPMKICALLLQMSLYLLSLPAFFTDFTRTHSLAHSLAVFGGFILSGDFMRWYLNKMIRA